MVECFHCNLKTMWRVVDNFFQAKAPLIVLFGLRKELKMYLNALSAEIIYGASLRFSGNFFTNTNLQTHFSDAMEDLKRVVQQLKQNSGRKTYMRPVFIPTKLSTMQKAFIRYDSVQQIFQTPYLASILPCDTQRCHTLSINIAGGVQLL